MQVRITKVATASAADVRKAVQFIGGIGNSAQTRRANRIADGETLTVDLQPAAIEKLRTLSHLVTITVLDGSESASTATETATETKGEDLTTTDNAANDLATALGKVLANAVSEDKVRSIVDAVVTDRLAGIPTVRIELQRGDLEPVEVEGLHHPMFATLLKMVSCRGTNGYVPNIWIMGEKSSGKSHAGRAVAMALGLPFYVMGTLAMAHEALGFVDGNGLYHSTAFVECFINGGVLQMDEIDSYEAHPTLSLNGPLANNYMTLPDGRFVERHRDCIIIGGANTWGMGATNDYIGRNKLDAAFLSRFPAKLQWNIDPALEQAFCGNVRFAERVQRARARAKAAGLKLGIDTRHTAAGAAFIAGGFTEDEAANLTYLAGLTDEQRKIVEGV